MGGLLLVAPEHRLSLQLKAQELWLRDAGHDRAVWAELQRLAGLPYQDLLDESDELLHHRRGCLGQLSCTPCSSAAAFIAANALHELPKLNRRPLPRAGCSLCMPAARPCRCPPARSAS